MKFQSDYTDLLVKNLIAHLPYKSAIVDKGGAIYSRNKLFDDDNWSSLLQEQSNAEKWDFACKELIKTKSEQYLRLASNIQVTINLLSSVDIYGPLFLVKINEHQENLQLSKAYNDNDLKKKSKALFRNQSIEFNSGFDSFLINEIDNCILVLNQDLQIIYSNSNAHELLKVSENELKGKLITDIVNLDFKNDYKSMLLEGRKLKLDLQLKFNGEIKEIGVILHSFVFKKRNHFLLTLNDITSLSAEIKKREEAEELANTIINTALDAVITANEDGKIVSWSNKAIEIFGYNEAEVIGKKISDVIIPEELQEYHEKGMARMKTSNKSNVTGRLIRLKAINKKREIFPVELFINQIKVKQRKLFTAFIRDISQLVKAEQNIIQSERQLSLLLSSIPSVPYTSSSSNVFEFKYLHSRILDLTGYEANDFLVDKINWKTRIHPRDIKNVLIETERLKLKGEAVIEYRLLNANNKYIWIRNSMKLNQNNDSSLESINGVFEDVTDIRLKKENELLVQKIELDILQLDWKKFADVNDYCQEIVRKINKSLPNLKTEIWDYHAELNGFSCIAGINQRLNNESLITPEESFFEKLINETYFFLNDIQILKSEYGDDVKDYLFSGIKRDGAIKGFIVFVTNQANTLESIEIGNFIKSVAVRLSLVAESFLRRATQEKLTNALFSGRMAVFEWEKNTNIVRWTEKLYELKPWGGLPKELDELLAPVHHEDRVLVEGLLQRVDLYDEASAVKFRVIDKSGILHYFEINLVKVNQKERVLGILKDVTSKTKAENELKRLNAGSNQLNSIIATLQNISDEKEIREVFCSSIVDNLSIADCFFVAKNNDSFEVLESEKSIHDTSRTIREQLISKTIKTLANCWKNREPVLQKVKLNERGGGAIQFIIIPFSVSEQVESLIVAYCSNFEDQSEARADFMMKSIEVLKQKLIKLRSEIALRKLNKELITSNSQLEQYSFIVAHNLRAPFSNVKGILELLDHDSLSNDKDQLLLLKLKETVYNIENILEDLNKLLTIQKSLEVNYEEINLKALVNSLLKTMEQDFQRVNAKVKLNIDERISLVACRPYVVSVFHNLLNNSIKYRRDDKQLEIFIEANSDQSQNTIIKFKDNGIGIDLKKYGDRVFKLYSRFHRHVNGTGLGLYLVKSQITAMGGKIDIDSNPGKGTTFYITLKDN